MSKAFMGGIVTVSRSERIVELSGAQFVGIDRNNKPLVLFRDPVTGSTCALLEEGITVAKVQAKLTAKRAEFGVRQ
jgi:hypothetical protein